MSLHDKLIDLVTDIAIEMVEHMAHRAMQQHGVVIEKRLKEKLVEEISHAVVVLDR